MRTFGGNLIANLYVICLRKIVELLANIDDITDEDRAKRVVADIFSRIGLEEN